MEINGKRVVDATPQGYSRSQNCTTQRNWNSTKRRKSLIFGRYWPDLKES